MKNIITSNDIRKGIENGSMKEIVKGNIKVIEVKKGSIYEGKKINKEWCLEKIYKIQRFFN